MHQHLQEQVANANAIEQDVDMVGDAIKCSTGDNVEMIMLPVVGKPTTRQPLELAETIRYPIAKFFV